MLVFKSEKMKYGDKYICRNKGNPTDYTGAEAI